MKSEARDGGDGSKLSPLPGGAAAAHTVFPGLALLRRGGFTPWSAFWLSAWRRGPAGRGPREEAWSLEGAAGALLAGV